jgi:hypothetical protein
MDTSGEGTANIVLYLVVLALFSQVGLRLLRASKLRRRFPVVALATTIVIGVPSLLQFAYPAITAALEREPHLTIQHGQWWRILTAVMAQDGGVAGAVFNLVVVALVTLLGEWIWGRWRTIVLFLAPSIALNLLAVFAWHASGGGSSFASDGLLMSMCGLALLTPPDVFARVCAALDVLVGVGLIVFLDDAHGVAVLLGAVLGALFSIPRLIARRRPSASQSPSAQR